MKLLGSTSTTFAEALALRPELQQKYLTFMDAIQSGNDVPERVLALCRARIEQIHGQVPDGISPEEASMLEAGQLDSFQAPEQAALVAAEKMPFQHHFILDEEVEDLKTNFGDAGCVSLLTALAFFDVTCRLNATMMGEG